MDITSLIKKVEKGTRYAGNEFGSIKKEITPDMVRFGFCFPDTYEVGMSHLGMKILYHLLNEQEDVFCERCFAPYPDMEDLLRQTNTELFTLETKDSLKKFDIVGFTLQYELSYSNILNMLDLAHIPIFSRERKADDPFVCAGGPCAYNGEPLWEFIDFFMLGEGEEVILEVVQAYREWKKSGETRQSYLERLAEIEGVYVPSFYDVCYNQDGTVKEIRPNSIHAKAKIKKRIIKDLDKAYYPEQVIVPFGEIVHDRVMLEVYRGCASGCRFCQAGMLYRPVREKSVQRLCTLGQNLISNTGYEELSLTSLSTGDYTHFVDLADKLLEFLEPNNTNLALPSLRLDSFNQEIAKRVQNMRKSSFTFAPEAGTQRMRDIINKNITHEDLMKSVDLAYRGGWTSLKLYFMIGLPGETDEDIKGIADLANEVYYAYPFDKGKNRVKITVSVASFVPKSFTPFQWVGQNSREELMRKQQIIKEHIRNKNIKYNYHDSSTGFLEGVFARGDRRISKVLYEAHKSGCKLDGWSEHFKMEAWLKAFETCGVDPTFYVNRHRSENEIFPYEHIDIGVSKEFLLREFHRSKEEKTTKSCRKACNMCGIQDFECGICKEVRK